MRVHGRGERLSRVIAAFTAFVTAAAFLLVVAPPPGEAAAPLPPGGTFTDDDGNVHEGMIEAIAAAGIAVGCNPPQNDRYCPAASVTRGQMATYLAGALDLPAAGTNYFVDDDGSVYEDDNNKLAKAGITRGCNPPANNRFCPESKVTRGQMAAFLVRAFAWSDRGAGNYFVDDDGSIFEGDIDKLAAAGVTKGCNPPANDRYCPDAPVRRDEMATLIGRALGLAPIDPPPRKAAAVEDGDTAEVPDSPAAVPLPQADKNVAKEPAWTGSDLAPRLEGDEQMDELAGRSGDAPPTKRVDKTGATRVYIRDAQGEWEFSYEATMWQVLAELVDAYREPNLMKFNTLRNGAEQWFGLNCAGTERSAAECKALLVSTVAIGKRVRRLAGFGETPVGGTPMAAPGPAPRGLPGVEQEPYFRDLDETARVLAEAISSTLWRELESLKDEWDNLADDLELFVRDSPNILDAGPGFRPRVSNRRVNNGNRAF
ncbi:MAG: hypothetical protein BMS9Abin07_2093 [Acidimicrobiia bacterium]|nr:MAG: hypothetical protein BMS9Abin07_2093 [Acidimicrobiia bacterium]